MEKDTSIGYKCVYISPNSKLIQYITLDSIPLKVWEMLALQPQPAVINCTLCV
jgi:hypothetical protein